MISSFRGDSPNSLADSAGLGVELQRTSQGPKVEHTGGTWGSCSILWFYPQIGKGAMVMINSAAGSLLQRLCVRVAAGLARTGAMLGHGSGDFVIAFSSAYRIPHRALAPAIMQPTLADEAGVMSGLFRAVIESVEEAVLNSLAAILIAHVFYNTTVVIRVVGSAWARTGCGL